MMHSELKYKKGVTLMELIVYMALSIVVMTITLRFARDNTVSSMRNLQRLEATKSIGEVGSYLAEDLRRLGAKWDQQDTLETEDNVYMDVASGTPDSSSFADFTDNGDLDAFTFRHALYDTVGDVTGWSEVTYSVNGSGALMREEDRTIGGATTNSVVTMAEGVQVFDVDFGLYSSKNYLVDFEDMDQNYISWRSGGGYSATNPTVISSGTAINVSNFVVDELYSMIITQGPTSPSTAVEVDLEMGKTYEAQFEFTPANGLGGVNGGNFAVGTSFLALGIRGAGTDVSTGLDGGDFLFYPGPDDTTRVRRFAFSPSVDKSVNFDIRYSFSGADASGDFLLRAFKVRELNDKEYQFVDAPADIDEKERVKALKIRLAIETFDGGSNTARAIRDSITKVIPIPNNGI